jgi:hypothetical protein
MGHFSRRRARLRPEYADLYPRVVPGLWLGARRVAAVVRRSDPSARLRELAGERTLPAVHFEFRGGPRNAVLRLEERGRASDRTVSCPGEVEDAAEATGIGRL